MHALNTVVISNLSAAMRVVVAKKQITCTTLRITNCLDLALHDVIDIVFVRLIFASVFLYQFRLATIALEAKYKCVEQNLFTIPCTIQPKYQGTNHQYCEKNKWTEIS